MTEAFDIAVQRDGRWWFAAATQLDAPVPGHRGGDPPPRELLRRYAWGRGQAGPAPGPSVRRKTRWTRAYRRPSWRPSPWPAWSNRPAGRW